MAVNPHKSILPDPNPQNPYHPSTLTLSDAYLQSTGLPSLLVCSSHEHNSWVAGGLSDGRPLEFLHELYSILLAVDLDLVCH